MSRLCLDLFCKAGGAGMGYHRAGYRVIGVDIEPQPHYPFDFIRADAFAVDWDGFDLVHASPPCQPHTRMRAMWMNRPREDQVRRTLEQLHRLDCPWVLENVPGAPFIPDTVLCGSMFGLGVRRHRWFAHNFPVKQPECDHGRQGRVVQVNGHSGGTSTRDGARHHKADWQTAMDIDWMTTQEMAQAIPPAYTDYLARFI